MLLQRSKGCLMIWPAAKRINHSAASPRCLLFFACVKRLCDAARPAPA